MKEFWVFCQGSTQGRQSQPSSWTSPMQGFKRALNKVEERCYKYAGGKAHHVKPCQKETKSLTTHTLAHLPTGCKSEIIRPMTAHKGAANPMKESKTFTSELPRMRYTILHRENWCGRVLTITCSDTLSIMVSGSEVSADTGLKFTLKKGSSSVNFKPL